VVLRCVVDGLLLEARLGAERPPLLAYDGDEAFGLEAVEALFYEVVSATADELLGLERAAQSALVRDIFTPFRPVAVGPAWLTRRAGAVPSLAQAAYDERDLPAGHLDPARLAVLADALDEAGCTDADVLNHLRGPGPHARGCWAVDLLLGKG
jgi:hypothetical protein